MTCDRSERGIGGRGESPRGDHTALAPRLCRGQKRRFELASGRRSSNKQRAPLFSAVAVRQTHTLLSSSVSPFLLLRTLAPLTNPLGVWIT